jgi:shikimate kinase/3-dehydroquinate synthase
MTFPLRDSLPETNRFAVDIGAETPMTEAEAIDLAKKRIGKRPIVLVGLMGCGKSSVGKRLAFKLSLPFVDADEEIERQDNK